MSYPKQIQTLIIEDDERPKSFYDALFASLRAQDVAVPRYAFCYDDAVKALNESAIFHLVILDLRLPERPKQPPSDQLAFGLGILERCMNRNEYPIPSLLVISGQLEKTNQTQLEEKVRNGFAYGRVVTKGSSTTTGNEEEIKDAIRQIQRYCDVGIHIQDSGDKVFPTLGPRDEYLLRRAILEQGQCEGIDVKWWGAEFSPPTGAFAAYKGWNKVLMGRFLLSEAIGLSRPRFFKLFPSGGSRVVIDEARILQHKLPHIKVLSALSAGDRSLLVTEKIGSSNADPVPLNHFLGESPSIVQPGLAQIVHEIASQIVDLRTPTPNQLPLKQVLWQDHDENHLRRLFQEFRPSDEDETLIREFEPTQTFSILHRNETIVRITQCLCHGDLNATNVALDMPEGAIHAYVIDASGMRVGVNVWDLAMLEITSVLHQPASSVVRIVRACSRLFQNSVAPPSDLNFETDDPRVGNTLRFITEIRLAALKLAEPEVYALMLFDVALIQLGGLAFRSMNKIQNPAAAATLACLAAQLLHRVAPQWLNS